MCGRPLPSRLLQIEIRILTNNTRPHKKQYGYVANIARGVTEAYFSAHVRERGLYLADFVNVFFGFCQKLRAF